MISRLSQIEMEILFPLGGVVGSGSGFIIDTVKYSEHVAFVMPATNVGGTDPTLDVVIEDSDSAVGPFAPTGLAFDQVLAVDDAQVMVEVIDQLRRYVRCTHTVGGTASPSYFYSCTMLARKKQ